MDTKILLCLVVYSCIIGCSSKDSSSVAYNQNVDSISYYAGVFNKSLSIQKDIEHNSEAYLRGLRETLKNPNFNIKKADAINVIAILNDTLKVQKAIVNYNNGLSFLALNKTHKGVNVTKSGLQYEVLKASEGVKVENNELVTLNVRGETIEGEIFIDTFRQRPENVQLKTLPLGLQEGVRMMSTGSRYRFYLPTELAYQAIPPEGTAIKEMAPVIYEVELLNVSK